MAQPPDISETFMREVDENLRRDQLRDFFKTYGNWMILAVALFLGASGGLIWWNQHQAQQSEGQVEQLAQTYKDIGSGDLSKAPKQLDDLSNGSSKAVRASAQFALAAVELQQGNNKAATATYSSIADDSSMPGALSRRRAHSPDGARVRQPPAAGDRCEACTARQARRALVWKRWRNDRARDAQAGQAPGGGPAVRRDRQGYRCASINSRTAPARSPPRSAWMPAPRFRHRPSRTDNDQN